MLTLSVVCLGASVTLSECNWATSSQQAVGLQLLLASSFFIVGIRSAHPRGRKYELEPIRNTSYMAMNAVRDQPMHTTCKRPNHLTTRADRPTDRRSARANERIRDRTRATRDRKKERTHYRIGAQLQTHRLQPQEPPNVLETELVLKMFHPCCPTREGDSTCGL